MTSVQETLRKQIDEQIKAKQTIQVNLSRSKADHAQLEDQFQAEKEAKKDLSIMHVKKTFKINIHFFPPS